MNFIPKIIDRISKSLLFIPALLLLSCSGENPVTSEGNEELFISAGIAKSVYTRAPYSNDGPVTSGTYFLSYPSAQNNNNYTIAEVIFGADDNSTRHSKRKNILKY